MMTVLTSGSLTEHRFDSTTEAISFALTGMLPPSSRAISMKKPFNRRHDSLGA
jgi:hypothetical protein